MNKCLLGRNPPRRIFLQHFGQQIEGLVADVAVDISIEVEHAVSVLLKNFIIPGPLENRTSEQKIMENNSNWKYVAYWLAFGRHISDIDDFRGHKSWGPAPDEQILLLVSVGGQAEVADGEVTWILFSEYDVFRFQVSMDYPVLVEVVDSSQDVLDDLPGLVAFDFLFALNVERSTLRISFSCFPSRYSKMT